MSRNNKFKKALKHLKNTSIDERLELVEALPVNNTTGIFVDVPGKDVEETTPAEIDSALDLDEDGDGELGYDGTDTTGLFTEDGTIRSIEPPGDRSYILGPMISMWYAWANYTQIGYVRQADRKMVNLGRIVGELDNWDGETGFTGYGQMSIEQAVWYKEQGRQDYRAFYPGPPSNPADEYGRYIGSIISGSKNDRTGVRDVWEPGTNRGFNPSDVLSLLLGTDDSGIFDFFSNLVGDLVDPFATAGKTFLGYLANLLPDVVDNDFLGQDYVDKAFTDMELSYDRNGNPISVVKDFIIGSGQKPTYDSTSNKIDVKFNYDFDTNAQAISKEPEKYNYKPGLNRLLMNVAGITGGDYGLDSTPILGAGALITIAKKMGGGEQKPGNISISPSDLQQKNPDLFNQLVNNGTIPADAVSKPSQNKTASKEGVKVDPKSAIESLRKNGPPELKMALEPTMSNFQKLSPKQQDMMMKGMKDQFVSQYDGSNYIDAPKYMKNQFKAQVKRVSKETTFKNGYMITKFPGGGTQKVALFSKSIPTRNLPGGGTSRTYKTGVPIAGRSTGATTRTGVTNSTGVTNRTGVTNTVQPKGGETLPPPQNSTEKFADDNGLPRDYKDKLADANAYFHNNLYKLPQRTDGALERMNKLMRTGYERQGFTKDQIDTIEKKQLVKNTYGASPSYKEPEPEPKSSNNSSGLTNAELAALAKRDGLPYYGTAGSNASQSSPRNTSTSNSFSNIRVGNTSKTSSGVKDYGNIAMVRDQPGDSPYNINFPRKPGQKTAPGPGARPTNKPMGPRLPSANVPGTKKYADIAANQGPSSPVKNYDGKIMPNPGAGKPGKVRLKPQFLPKAKTNTPSWERNPWSLVAGYEPEGLVLSEKRKRILRDIKKPVQVKEMPTKFKVKPTGRKYKNKDVGVDMMKIPDTPAAYKPQTNIWQKKDYAANVRASQEKKNEVLELVGAAEHHWTYLTEDRRKKKQEEMNERLSIEFDNELEMMYEKHKIKEAKITKAMSAFKKSNDIKPEYPENPPPELDPNTGMHPKYGKHYKHNKLDPQSAEAMPPTGDPEIDANVKKATNAKEKARKLKILLGKKA